MRGDCDAAARSIGEGFRAHIARAARACWRGSSALIDRHARCLLRFLPFVDRSVYVRTPAICHTNTNRCQSRSNRFQSERVARAKADDAGAAVSGSCQAKPCEAPDCAVFSLQWIDRARVPTMAPTPEERSDDSVQKLVIAHADDIGMCHGANTAFAAVAGRGFITSGSVMVPCPWFREIAEMAASDAQFDLGVHLTLTSEWRHYRWRPLTGASKANGLVDDDGYMWRTARAAHDHAHLDAVEAELRAQIDAALAAGIDATHL